MTKTKAQKQRAKQRTIKKRMKKRQDFNFLNGNSIKLGLRKGQQRNVGRQAGTYVNAPISSTFVGLSSKAKMMTRGDGVTTVEHSEYFGDLKDSTGFAMEGMPINPGNITVFPWLASIAKRYESYKFRSLVFRYETQAPTTSTGSVIMSIDYNPNAPLPTNKTEALAMESAVRSAPWQRVVHRSTSANLNKRSSYFVRNQDNTSTGRFVDADLYDTGTFMVGTEGISDLDIRVGELYVDYVVDLMTPMLTNPDTSGYSSEITATSVATPPTQQFLFEEFISVTPDGAPFVVGPGINVTTTEGTPGVPVGAVTFTEPGSYLLDFTFWRLDGTTLDPTNWGYGFSSGDSRSSATNLNPLGDVVALDSTEQVANASFIVTVPFVPTNFGIGSSATLTGADRIHSQLVVGAYKAPSDTVMGFRALHRVIGKRIFANEKPKAKEFTLAGPPQSVITRGRTETIKRRVTCADGDGQNIISKVPNKPNEIGSGSHPTGCKIVRNGNSPVRGGGVFR